MVSFCVILFGEPPVTDERPDPSWTPEQMERYMKKKYGDYRIKDVHTGQPLSWKEALRLFDATKRDSND
jgi:hypothetical protein